MNEIKIFSHSVPEIGYIARTSTQGDEFDMVNKYIEYVKKKYGKLKKKKIAIFIEPQLDTGYPDIVIVEYYHSTNSKWNNQRDKLSISDLKILFQVQQQKNATINSLSRLLGFSESEIERSIHKLFKCEMLYLSKNQKHVRNVRLSTYCHINKIISIEAKIDKWSEAILQASKNIWFSTESYILMNKDICNDVIVKKCTDNGIGIILVNGKIQKLLKSEQRTFPVSFSSLIFNEWIQRNEHLHLKEETF